jgi:hypothetical protein
MELLVGSTASSLGELRQAKSDNAPALAVTPDGGTVVVVAP